MNEKGSQTWTEAERLVALHRTGLLDAPTEKMFDDLVQLAAQLVGVPMAAIHLVDAERQWAVAEIGLRRREMPRDRGFCPVAMTEPDGMVVSDATKDPRFANNPLVTNQPGIRFYAGVPLVAEGLPVGALCVLDTVPHMGLTAEQRFALNTLAAQVAAQIELRSALARQSKDVAARAKAEELLAQEVAERTNERDRFAALEVRFRALVSATSDSIYRMSPDWLEMRTLDGRGFIPDTMHPSVRWLDLYIDLADRPMVTDAIKDSIDRQGLFELEHRVRRTDGSFGHTMSRAVPIFNESGEIIEWFGAASDVTARHDAEEQLREAKSATGHCSKTSTPVSVSARSSSTPLADPSIISS